MTGRLEFLGEDGEWREVPGIATVELRQEQPGVEPRDEVYRRHDAFDAMVYALPEIAEAMAISVAEVREAHIAVIAAYEEAAHGLPATDHPIRQGGNPVRDRPA